MSREEKGTAVASWIERKSGDIEALAKFAASAIRVNAPTLRIKRERQRERKRGERERRRRRKREREKERKKEGRRERLSSQWSNEGARQWKSLSGHQSKEWQPKRTEGEEAGLYLKELWNGRFRSERGKRGGREGREGGGGEANGGQEGRRKVLAAQREEALNSSVSPPPPSPPIAKPPFCHGQNSSHSPRSHLSRRLALRFIATVVGAVRYLGHLLFVHTRASVMTSMLVMERLQGKPARKKEVEQQCVLHDRRKRHSNVRAL